MGPPPRSLAAEANDCFMVQTLQMGSTEYKVVAWFLAPYGGLPSVRWLWLRTYPSEGIAPTMGNAPILMAKETPSIKSP